MEYKETMKGLLNLCRNSEKQGCHPYVFKYKQTIRSIRKIDRYNISSQWPSEEEIKRLNEICSECDYRFFWIEKKECPVCERQSFKEVKSFEFFNGEIKTREDYFLTCKNCGTFSRFISLV
jgi:hypothetical protein